MSTPLSILRFLLLSFISVSLLACGDGELSSEGFLQEDSDSIINGSIVPANHTLARHVLSLRFQANTQKNLKTGTVTRTTEYCSAVALNSRTLIAAAHCIPKGDKVSGYVIARNLDGSDFRVRVQDYIQHEKYILSSQTVDNDIALFLLESELPAHIVSYTSIPAATDQYNLAQFIIAGFGQYIEGQTLLENSLRLRSGTAKTIDFKLQRRYFIADNSGETSVCSGDSGGPALIQDSSGRYYVLGIASTVSYTSDKEGKCNQEAIYMNIRSYVNWIVENSRKLMQRTLVITN